MPKPFLNSYPNDNGDYVLVYIGEVDHPMADITPQHIVIKKEHIQDLISELNEAYEDMGE
jgi:hypothetical protein